MNFMKRLSLPLASVVEKKGKREEEPKNFRKTNKTSMKKPLRVSLPSRHSMWEQFHTQLNTINFLINYSSLLSPFVRFFWPCEAAPLRRNPQNTV